MSFFIQLILNGNIPFTMCVNGDMLFKDLVNCFCQNTGLNQDNKATFSINSNEINSESINKLKDLGIKAFSVIQVKTEKPLNMPNNAGNMPNFQMQQNNAQMGMNMNNYGNMNMAQNMNQNNNMAQNMNVAQNNNMAQNMNMNQNNNMGQNMNMAQNNNMPQNMNMAQNMNMFQNMNNFGNMMNMNPIMFNNMIQNMNMAQNMNMGQNSNNQNTQNTKVDEKEKDFINVVVNFQSKNITIQISSDRKFSELAQKFYNKAGLKEKPAFIFNSKMIDPNDDRTLKNIGFYDQCKIDAVFSSQIVGA